MNPALDAFLASSKTALAHLLAVAQEFYAQQNATPVINEGGTVDPPMMHIGDPVVLKSKTLEQSEIDAIIGNYADAIVKEKAIAYVKGFVSALMLAGGGA